MKRVAHRLVAQPPPAQPPLARQLANPPPSLPVVLTIWTTISRFKPHFLRKHGKSLYALQVFFAFIFIPHRVCDKVSLTLETT
jgi:hypothetical protein